MKPFFLLAVLMLITHASTTAAEPDTRLFEMRTYYAAPGKLDNLHARFRNHTLRLFEKHGMTNIGYWVPIENPENKLIYVLAYPGESAREAAWKAFTSDPEWKAAAKASEENGKLVAKVEKLFLQATDFSPEIQPGIGAAPRSFELRTYTTVQDRLPNLLERFRNHTTALFAHHGMTNLFYWTPVLGQTNADVTLIYMLAHASPDAARASFDAFRADPEWVAAKAASEGKAGGSLTIPDGVKSVYLQATDYSPTR